jgi:hypothetical protein
MGLMCLMRSCTFVIVFAWEFFAHFTGVSAAVNKCYRGTHVCGVSSEALIEMLLVGEAIDVLRVLDHDMSRGLASFYIRRMG